MYQTRAPQAIGVKTFEEFLKAAKSTSHYVYIYIYIYIHNTYVYIYIYIYI